MRRAPKGAFPQRCLPPRPFRDLQDRGSINDVLRGVCIPQTARYCLQFVPACGPDAKPRALVPPSPTPSFAGSIPGLKRQCLHFRRLNRGTKATKRVLKGSKRPQITPRPRNAGKPRRPHFWAQGPICGRKFWTKRGCRGISAALSVNSTPSRAPTLVYVDGVACTRHIRSEGLAFVSEPATPRAGPYGHLGLNRSCQQVGCTLILLLSASPECKSSISLCNPPPRLCKPSSRPDFRFPGGAGPSLRVFTTLFVPFYR